MVLVLYPASLSEWLLQESIATRDDENFGVIFKSFFLFPLLHICNIGMDLNLFTVSFHECFQIWLDECLFLNNFFTWWFIFFVIWGLQTIFIVKLGWLLGVNILFILWWLLSEFLIVSFSQLPCFGNPNLFLPLFFSLFLNLLIFFLLDLFKHFILLFPHPFGSLLLNPGFL